MGYPPKIGRKPQMMSFPRTVGNDGGKTHPFTTISSSHHLIISSSHPIPSIDFGVPPWLWNPPNVVYDLPDLPDHPTQKPTNSWNFDGSPILQWKSIQSFPSSHHHPTRPIVPSSQVPLNRKSLASSGRKRTKPRGSAITDSARHVAPAKITRRKPGADRDLRAQFRASSVPWPIEKCWCSNDVSTVFWCFLYVNRRLTIEHLSFSRILELNGPLSIAVVGYC